MTRNKNNYLYFIKIYVTSKDAKIVTSEYAITKETIKCLFYRLGDNDSKNRKITKDYCK
mgnify:CR=1 FL=1